MISQRRRDPVLRHYEWDLTLWATSQTRAQLDAAGRGIYRELLDLCYAQGGFSIRPLEPLCRVLGCSSEQFDAAWEVLKRHFERNGRSFFFTNCRALQARKDYSEFCEKQRARRSGDQISKPLKTGIDLTGGQSGGQPAVEPESKVVLPKRNETKRNEIDTIPAVNATAEPPPDVEWIADHLHAYAQAGRGPCSQWERPDADICHQVLSECRGRSRSEIELWLKAQRAMGWPDKSYAWFVTMARRRFGPKEQALAKAMPF